jgi:hypothetical protein
MTEKIIAEIKGGLLYIIFKKDGRLKSEPKSIRRNQKQMIYG